MSGIDPGRVAEVLVTLAGPGPGRRGSGYRVSGSAVLTAAHVVRGATRVRVRFDADQPGERITDAEVAWADDGVDAAVLTLAGEAGDDPVPEAGFGRVAAADAVLTCSAVGFPRFKLRRDPAEPGDDSPSQYRDSVHATGTIAVLSNRREGTLEVIVAAPERDDDPERSPWEGMSGAAVWSAGQIIGVVTEHHRSDGLGRLAASRVDRWYTKLTGKQGGALRRVLPWLPVAPGELTEVVPATEAERLQAGYLAQVRDIAPAELIGRDTELAKLVRFCAGPDAYTWWQAGPWAGKSALAAWFVLHPPAGPVIASFFVTSRLTGQADSDAFTEAMIEQLAAIAGEPVTGQATPAGRDRERRRLLEAAAARVAARQQRLVLVIDGLDEDVGPAASGLPSIAALLPRNPDPVVRILITSRPHPGIPDDVPAGHPLRRCDQYQLPPSSLAQDIQYEAKTELMSRLHGDPLQVDVIGFITAAGGGLTLAELAELTGEPRWNLKSKLGSVFGRSLLTRQSYDPPTEDPEDRVYLFAHETLRATAEHELAHDLSPYRERLHAWADDYRSQGWPETTPRYLLRPYGRMLATSQDLSRLIRAATNTARQDRMLAQTFGDAAALAEIAAAQQLILAQDSPDFITLARLVLSQNRLERRTVPAQLAELWARLGQTHRAEALARSFRAPDDQATALSGIAAGLAATDRDLAIELASEAERKANEATRPFLRTFALRDLAQQMAQAQLWDVAVRAVRSIEAPADRATELCALAGQAHGEQTLVTALADEALDTVLAIEDRSQRDQAMVKLVEGLAGAGLWDMAEHAAGMPGSEVYRTYALRAAIEGLTAAQRWDAAHRVALSYSEADERALALATLATAIGPHDQEKAIAVATEAEELATEELGRAYTGLTVCRALAAVAVTVAQADSPRSGRLAARVERLGRPRAASGDSAAKLAAAARAWRATDEPHALTLAHDAVRLASATRNTEDRSTALEMVSEELAWAGFWELAVQAARAIPDDERQGWTLRDLVERLGQADRWDQAEELAQTIPEQEERWDALSDVVSGLIRSEHWDHAERVAASIPGEDQRDLALNTVVEGLISTGLLPQGERVARTSGSAGYFQALNLATVAIALAGTDRHRAVSMAAEAERIARAAPGSRSEGRELAVVAGAMAGVDRRLALSLLAEADRAFDALPSARDDLQGLTAVTIALASLDSSRLQEAGARVAGIIGNLPSSNEQSWQLRQVAKDLISVGLVDQIMQAARVIRAPDDRADALASVASIVAKFDRKGAAECANEAVRVALSITDGLDRDFALRSLTGQLARAGLRKQAKRAALRIRDPEIRLLALPGALVSTAQDDTERAQALPALAVAVAQAVLQEAKDSFAGSGQLQQLSVLAKSLAMAVENPGRAARAERTARDIPDPARRALAISSVAILVSLTEPEHAQGLAAESVRVAEGLPDWYERSQTLAGIAGGIGVAGHWEQAIRAALAIPTEYVRVDALHQLSAGLIAAGLWDQAVTAAQAMEGSSEQGKVIDSIVAGLARDHRWDQAEAAARLYTDPDEQAQAHGIIVTELVTAGLAEAANPDRDPGEKDNSWRSRARQQIAAMFISTSWTQAVKPLSLLHPEEARAIGELLLTAQQATES